METVLSLGVWLFVVTHVDTVVVLSAFCADNDYRGWEILVGHYVGFCVGLSIAIVGAIVTAELIDGWTFLLGVVPLSLGLWGLIRSPPETTIEDIPAVPNTAGRIGVVAVTGLGLSGENIAVFVPFFADLTVSQLALIVCVYLVGAGVVYGIARQLVSRVTTDGIPEWLDRWLVPTVLVCIGGYVIVTGLIVA